MAKFPIVVHFNEGGRISTFLGLNGSLSDTSLIEFGDTHTNLNLVPEEPLSRVRYRIRLGYALGTRICQSLEVCCHGGLEQ